ncbi:MAG: hypothetical protein HY455_00785 [Parcubacteria group bacterium]|nr:hypothetical protein [Parcubacteria group bacterium]
MRIVLSLFAAALLAACAGSIDIPPPRGNIVPMTFERNELDGKLHKVGEEESIQAGVVVPLFEFDNLPGEWGESCMVGARRVAKQTDWYNIGEICAPDFHGVYRLGGGKNKDVWITVRPLVATGQVPAATVKSFALDFVSKAFADLNGRQGPVTVLVAPSVQELPIAGHIAYCATVDAVWEATSRDGQFVRRFYDWCHVFVGKNAILAFTFEYRATDGDVPLDFKAYIEATIRDLRFFD